MRSVESDLSRRFFLCVLPDAGDQFWFTLYGHTVLSNLFIVARWFAVFATIHSRSDRWAFSSVGNVESAFYLSGNELPNLSGQQVVSCHLVDLDCDGGDLQTAFEYVMSAPVDGLVFGLVHPYHQSTWCGDSRVCNATLASPENRIATITGYVQVSMGAFGESLMLLAVLVSPFSTALNAIPMETYQRLLRDLPKKRP